MSGSIRLGVRRRSLWPLWALAGLTASPEALARPERTEEPPLYRVVSEHTIAFGRPSQARGLPPKRLDPLDTATWFPWYLAFFGCLVAIPTALFRDEVWAFITVFPLDPRGLPAVGWGLWLVVFVAIPLGGLGIVGHSFSQLGVLRAPFHLVASAIVGALAFAFAWLLATALVYLVVGLFVATLALLLFRGLVEGAARSGSPSAEDRAAEKALNAKHAKEKHAADMAGRRDFYGDDREGRW